MSAAQSSRRRHHLVRAKHTGTDGVARTQDGDDLVVLAGQLADGFVKVRVEGLIDRVDLLDLLPQQQRRQLLRDQLDALAPGIVLVGLVARRFAIGSLEIVGEVKQVEQDGPL